MPGLSLKLRAAAQTRVPIGKLHLDQNSSGWRSSSSFCSRFYWIFQQNIHQPLYDEYKQVRTPNKNFLSLKWSTIGVEKYINVCICTCKMWMWTVYTGKCTSMKGFLWYAKRVSSPWKDQQLRNTWTCKMWIWTISTVMYISME